MLIIQNENEGNHPETHPPTHRRHGARAAAASSHVRHPAKQFPGNHHPQVEDNYRTSRYLTPPEFLSGGGGLVSMVRAIGMVFPAFLYSRAARDEALTRQLGNARMPMKSTHAAPPTGHDPPTTLILP